MKKLFIIIAILLVGCEAKNPKEGNNQCSTSSTNKKVILTEEQCATTFVQIGEEYFSVQDLIIILEEELKQTGNEISKVY